ncbi:hypothetical protein QJS10_CPB21g01547 [Acorus calamus]|uniref:Uncharacterized protein n=1 Tax=Acorus calamus TaxID=4465 RepID=A0AAV9C6C4_ACOCL|nr:hypothetical protein QJS10_CPB21g01547 [Acorus calamus]
MPQTLLLIRRFKDWKGFRILSSSYATIGVGRRRSIGRCDQRHLIVTRPKNNENPKNDFISFNQRWFFGEYQNSFRTGRSPSHYLQVELSDTPICFIASFDLLHNQRSKGGWKGQLQVSFVCI